MSYQRIVSANKDSITLADGTTFKPINYRNHLPLYDKDGNINTNLDKFYNEYNNQFISNAAPMLIGLYVNPAYLARGGGSSRRNNYKKSVRCVKTAKRSRSVKSRKYRNRK
jgi:hypothetical protein